MKEKKSNKLHQYKTVKLPIDDITWESFVKLIKSRKQFKGGAIVELIENELDKNNNINNSSITSS